ncbi:hypothetical protein [Kitasatospora sp. NPDC018619]|uniref:hypothetical protein n=1 Tax=unclassified Kitasatospora TaxID=2633591 RepID=UPI00378FD580
MPETSEPPAAPRPPVPPTLPPPLAAPPSPVLPAEPPGAGPAPTGHPGVDAALARLEVLDGVPAEAHVAVYEDVHQRLVDALAALDRE